MWQARVLAGAAAVALMAPMAWAQDGKSTAGAKELAQVLAEKKLDAIAAKDPSSPNGFVAALHFPGQLMVMSATYPAPALLNERLARREYRDVYIEINSASPVDSRMFVTDIGADGLRAKRIKRDDPFDVRHKAGTALNFDGNWRAQKLSEADYMKAFAEADDRYAQAVALLLAEAKK
jgi:hypothetical protein